MECLGFVQSLKHHREVTRAECSQPFDNTFNLGQRSGLRSGLPSINLCDSHSMVTTRFVDEIAPIMAQSPPFAFFPFIVELECEL